MKAIHWITAVAALAFVQAAQAAQTDPETIIYRFTGVLDDGAPDSTGVATSFHCSNFSGVAENIRFVTRDFSGVLRSNIFSPISHLNTVTVGTHRTAAYSENATLATGGVSQGTTAIAATSINIICTAMTIDASTTVPIGVALHGIRLSPVPGSQE